MKVPHLDPKLKTMKVKTKKIGSFISPIKITARDHPHQSINKLRQLKSWQWLLSVFLDI